MTAGHGSNRMRYLFLLLLFCSGVWADSAIITWIPPTERTDGTPLPADEIDGYILRIDGAMVTDTIPPGDTTYTVSGLSVGTYSFDMATRDTVGRTGPFSDAVQRHVDAGPGSVESFDVQIVP